MPQQSRRQEYARQTRVALIEAGTSRIVSQGYEDTSIAQIASDARVSKGAVYHHFPDKRSLFKAVLTTAISRSSDEIKLALQSKTTVNQSGYLASTLDTALRSIQKDPVYRTLRQQAMGILSSSERKAIDDEYRTPLIDQIFDEIEAADNDLHLSYDRVSARIVIGCVIDTACEEIVSSDDSEDTYMRFRPILEAMLESLFRNTAPISSK